MKKNLPSYLIASVLLTGLAQGNFRLSFDTDATATPTTGSYTGGGTLDANIVTGTQVTNNAQNFQITGVTDGDVLTVDIYDDASFHNFAPDIMNMTTTFNLEGAGETADVEFAVANGAFKGWNVDNLAGVTELRLTSVFSDPIHGRTDLLTALRGLPWGFSTGLLSSGTGLEAENFNITYIISDIYHSDTPTDTTSYTAGMETIGVTTRASTGWESFTSTSTTATLTSTNGFDGTTGWTGNERGNGDSTNNLLVRGFIDDGGSLSATRVQEFVATTYQVIITPTGTDIDGNPITEFATDTRFVFSYDGDRRQIVPQSVPEPTGFSLLCLSTIALLSRRKRL